MWLVVVRDRQDKICAKMPLADTPITIGRSKDRVIHLDSRAVSRAHGRIELRGDAVFYVDEGSANGSWVDGRPVTGAVQVNELSVIQLGEEFRIALLRPVGSVNPEATLVMRAPTAPVAPPVAVPPQFLQAPTPAPADDDLDLTPMAPPPPPRPAVPAAAAPKPAAVPGAMTPPIAGMQFKIPDAPKAAPPAVDKLSAASLLDQQIRGIQSRRSELEENTRNIKDQFERAWREAVTAARELQGRIRGNPKVMYYVISRDEMEVSVKISDSSKRGYVNLIVSRRHPEKGNLQDGIIWLAVLGEEPVTYREPKEAIEDFVRRIASKLA